MRAMNNMSLRGSSVYARRRVPHGVDDLSYSHTDRVRRRAIRLATLAGCLLAFALLWMLPINANAAWSVGNVSQGVLVEASRQASAPGAYDTAGSRVHPARDAFAHKGADPGTTPFAFASKNGEGAAADRLAQSASASAAVAAWQPGLSALTGALAVAAVLALISACLSRSTLKRATDKHKQITDEWARRCEAAEARAQGGHLVATRESNAVPVPEQSWLPGATPSDVNALWSAGADLLDSLDTPSGSFAQRRPLAVIQSALRTWSQTLGDLLDSLPLESRAVIIDESATNLRALIDGVIALTAPSATQRGLRLSASVDRQLADTILADHARLGQLCFHLLNRTFQLSTHREIVLVVRTEPVNSRSQRILISVMETGERTESLASPQVPGFTADDPDTDRQRDVSVIEATAADTCLPLCRLLAQRMQGDLSITSGLAAGVRASFNASFGVEQWGSFPRRSPAAVQPPLPPIATNTTNTTKPRDASPSTSRTASTPAEPFEHRYLDALSDEGVDLPTFLDGWRRAMGDDLARLCILRRRQSHPDHVSGLLHRLSGAAGLVGALSLMEALRRASASPLEQSTGSIDALIERTRNLVKQFETPQFARRNT
jgi:hypothetical protein